MTAHAQVAALAPALKTKDDKKLLKMFARGVQKLRKGRKLTRQQFADLIHLSYSNTANIELGHNWPSMPAYIRICEVLGVGVPPLMK
jgi:transcriptional regulator with XRE-family HTH domain